MFASCGILSKDVSIKDNVRGWVKLIFIFRSFVPYDSLSRSVSMCISSILTLDAFEVSRPFFYCQHTSYEWTQSFYSSENVCIESSVTFWLFIFERVECPTFCHYTENHVITSIALQRKQWKHKNNNGRTMKFVWKENVLHWLFTVNQSGSLGHTTQVCLLLLQKKKSVFEVTYQKQWTTSTVS